MILILCFTASCKQEDVPTETVIQDEPGTVYVLSGFETERDLFALRPSIQQMDATMDIATAENGQVKAGSGSMRYSFRQGNWPDMVLHIKNSAYPELDIGNLNKMNLSVYNDNDQPVNGVLAVVVGGNKTLLSMDFTLEPKQWNDLEFRLSALACKFNADQILGFRFRMEATENSVFYFDDWSVTMGAENTAEDDQWEPLLMEIISRIDALPQGITAEDQELLDKIYTDYVQLPEVYRNIVPNYDKLLTAIQGFVDAKYAAEEDALERNYLAFDQFYGVGQLESANYTILYQTEVKYGDEKGALKITFDGSTKESYFPYRSPLDPKRYDYMEISVYNDDDLRKVIYFNWNQRLVIEPHTWGTMKVVGKELISNGNLIVDTIDAQGTRIQSSGTIYISAMRAYRRDLLLELKKLPDASTFRMDRDIKYLTLIERTKALYDSTPEAERMSLPQELVDNMMACWKKCAGYKTVVDAIQEDIEFGTPDCAAVGSMKAAQDDTYGPIWELTFTEKAPGAYAAGFRFVKDISASKNKFFFIYNPQSSAQYMELYSDGSWNNLEMRLLEPGWNRIDIPSEVPANHYIFGLFSKNARVAGTWKVSSLYEVSDAIVNRQEAAAVSALIKALPDPASVKMPQGLKYVADIWEAYEAYEALAPGGKAGVSGGLKNKLHGCMDAIEGYKAAINPNTDEMTVGTPDCVCGGTMKIGFDETYGAVYLLNITDPGTGDYAGGFQVNKDISEDENLYFYIYNPKQSAQTMYLYANPTWSDMGERVLNPGWNRIDLPKNAKIDRYIFGLFPKNADIKGQWKISSVFSKSQTLVDREEAQATSDMIDALPQADSLSMPRDLKLAPAIYQAKESYDSLSAAAKKHITKDQLAKLNACLDAAQTYRVVVNALSDEMAFPPDTNCQGLVGKAEAEQYGPVFTLDITKAGDAPYTGGFRVVKDLSDYGNMYFHIYNPSDTDQVIWLYADNWEPVGGGTVLPGWNKIEIPNSVKIDQSLFGLITSDGAVGQWKITSIYSVYNEALLKQEAAAVETQIQALPEAAALSLADKAAVEEAKEAYDSLSADAEAFVSQQSKDKLDACLAQIAKLEREARVAAVEDKIAALPETVDLSHKMAVEEAKAAFDALVAEEQAMVSKAAQKKLKAAVDTIQELLVNGRADAVMALIDALPNSVTMPADLKWFAPIQEAKAAYDDLGQDNAGVSQAHTDKLNGLLEKTAAYSVAADAMTTEMVIAPDSNCKAVIGSAKVSDYGPVFTVNITQAGSAPYTGGFRVNKDLTGKKDLFFYLYNPSAAPQVIWFYADNWEGAGGGTVQPGWNKIDIPSNAQIDTCLFGLITSDGAVGEWKVTSFYSVDKELLSSQAVKEVARKLEALPLATELKLTDKAAVEEAKAAYDALSADEQALISQDALAKLDACMTQITLLEQAQAVQTVEGKIAALPEADKLKVSDTDAVKAAQKAFDALTEKEQGQVSNAAKLTACGEKVAQWESWDAKTVISAATDMIAAHGDDNTYGTVWMPAAGGAFEVIRSESAAYGACEAIEFYIYNPTDAEVNGFIQDDVRWSNVVSFTLAPKDWTKITVEQKDLGSGKKLLSDSVKMYLYVNFTGEGWKMSSIFRAEATADPEAEAIAALNGMIAELPEANAIGGSHKTAISEAKTAYDALSEEGKAKVENADKLEACLEKVAAWDALAGKIAMDAKDAVITSAPTWNNITTNVDDNTFGTVMTFADSTALAFPNGAVSDKYKNAGKIEFYIYNPTAAAVALNIQDSVDWSDCGQFELAAGAWTHITVVEKTLSNGKKLLGDGITMFVNATCNGSGWKMSSIYAGEAEEQPAPVPELTGEVIKAVGSSFYIWNHSAGTESGMTVTAGTDESYGDVFVIQHDAGVDATKVSLQGINMTGYETVQFCIYNPGAEAITCRVQEAGDDWGTPVTQTLAAGEWTKVTVTCGDYGTTDVLIYIDGTVGTEYKMTEIKGTKPGATDPTPTPELTGEVIKAVGSSFYIWNHSAGAEGGLTITAGTDESYGDVFVIQHATGVDPTKVSFQGINMTGYETVQFCIYNPDSKAITCRVQEAGDDWATPVTQTLAAGEWTKVTVTCGDYGTTDVLIYIDGTVGTEYKMTEIRGTKASG